MDLYSALLSGATGAAVVAVVLALAVRLGPFRARLVQWVAPAAGLAILATGLAAVYHLVTDHGPGSRVPLDPITFTGEHKVVLVIPAVALLALGLGRVPRTRGSGR